MIKERICGLPKIWVSHFAERQECAGCQYPIVYRIVFEVIEEIGIVGDTVIVGGAACGAGILLNTPTDTIMPNHGQCIDVATGIKRSSPESIVLVYGGDGDVAAIGAGAFLNAAGRAEKFTQLMLNNGHYAMTGGQLAPTSLMGQVTSTTPDGRDSSLGYPINMAELAASIRGVAYSARGAVNNIKNFQQTKKYLKTGLQKQIDGVGLSFLEILSACPTGWHMNPLESLKWLEEEMIPQFPLGEFKNADHL
jgi:2-oxoglutarate ferredoxin oxidoreductase subunit beta